MKRITKQDCEHLKQRFEAYCEIAGQHEFLILAKIDRLLEITWIDLDNDIKNNQKDLNAMFRVILKTIGATEEAKDYEIL